MRVERTVPDASPCTYKTLVCAGPGGRGGFLALRKMLCAVLLCRLSIGDSSPPKNMVVSGQCTQCAPLEGEAPAEPK